MAHVSAVPLLHDYLGDSARRAPEKVALGCDGRTYTFADLDRETNRFANALARIGVERGDRVLVQGENVYETVIAFWGTLRANAVATVISAQLRPEKLAYLLSDCRPAALVASAHATAAWAEVTSGASGPKRVIVTGDVRRQRIAGLERAVAWDEALRCESPAAPPPRRAIDVDLAAIVYTSGSTGHPKGVMLSHRNMLAASSSIASYLECREDDVVLCALPLSFDYGLYQIIMAAKVGARVVLERSFAYPAEILSRIAAEGVTAVPGVPTVFAMWAEAPNVLREVDLSRVRYVTNTAAALSARHVAFLRSSFKNAQIYSMYGLTECKRVSYLPPADIDRKPTSVGIPIPNTEVWVVDAEGKRLGPGNVGELVVRGSTVMRGYWGKPGETAKKLRPGPLPGEQVLHTGDLVMIDDEGYLHFIARMDDIIKSRGEKVAPKEVENALAAIPGVKEAAVVGVPDPILGHALKAFVVLEKGSSLRDRDVIRGCQERLESFMVPKYVVFVPDLPKSENGKIVKEGLR
jgi:amino acid adenylation domain-containing protein